jgi:hypothetical protein
MNTCFYCCILDIIPQNTVANKIGRARGERIQCCLEQACGHIILQADIARATRSDLFSSISCRKDESLTQEVRARVSETRPRAGSMMGEKSACSRLQRRKSKDTLAREVGVRRTAWHCSVLDARDVSTIPYATGSTVTSMPSFFRCAAATMPLMPAPMTAALFGLEAMTECRNFLTLSTARSHLEASLLPAIRFRPLAQELQVMPYAHAHANFKIHSCICKHPHDEGGSLRCGKASW